MEADSLAQGSPLKQPQRQHEEVVEEEQEEERLVPRSHQVEGGSFHVSLPQGSPHQQQQEEEEEEERFSSSGRAAGDRRVEQPKVAVGSVAGLDAEEGRGAGSDTASRLEAARRQLALMSARYEVGLVVVAL